MQASHDRDIARFDRWGDTYEQSPLQLRFFRPVQRATLELTADLTPAPQRVLDLGCGTGAFMRLMRERFPATHFVGVDAARSMLTAGRRSADLESIALVCARAERLPFSTGSFDLVTSTVSFHHWSDQRRGLAEVARVLSPSGIFVLTDLHAIGWLRVVFALGRRRARMHTRTEITAMCAAADMRVLRWAPIFDLDPFLPLRRRPRNRRSTGRIPLVTAVAVQRTNT